MSDSLEKIGFYTLSDERARTSSPTSRMMRGEIILTETCNFRCPYCRGLSPWVYGNRPKAELTFEEACHYVDLWSTNGQAIKNIRFSGGEPTVVKWLPDLISYAKNSGVERIAISTNGSADFSLYEDLINRGCNDFSISLDACCAEDAEKMAGRKKIWKDLIRNIREISARTYVTVGVVLTPENLEETGKIITFADSLGVSDIRIISSAQYNGALSGLSQVPKEILERHPILKYRINRYLNGQNVRGILPRDHNRCPLMMDDSILAGEYHFPCIIYMREGGQPIGKINPEMRKERVVWSREQDTHQDSICRENCLDVCISFNNRMRDFSRDGLYDLRRKDKRESFPRSYRL